MIDLDSAPIILVDGSSYLFRAFHAMPPLTSSKGQPTGAIKGVINMIRRLYKDYPKSDIVVIFDAKGKNFRHNLYPDYKANRPPMPDDLRSQIAPIHDIIKAMGLPLLVIPDVEADDVIGTLAHQATAQGIEALISTGDKDMAQLVSEHVNLINTMTDTHMDKNGVIEKFGVPPERIIDYLALVGDSVDNIPGVPKCGPKTAVKWLNKYGSMAEVIAQAEGIKGKIGEYLRDSIPHLPLSYQLATIRCDVPMEQTLDQLLPTDPDRLKLNSLYTELEFRSWISTSKTTEAAPESITPKPEQALNSHYETILTQKALDSWIDKLTSAKQFAFDTETTSLNYMIAQIVGISFAITPFHAAYLPLAHDYLGVPQQLDRDAVLAQIKPVLENPEYRKIGQNLKYDRSVLANHGIHLRGIAEDTMLASYVLNSTATRHNMDSLAKYYLQTKTIHFEDIAGKGVKQLSFNQIELEKASPYAAEDADVTLRLYQHFKPKLETEPKLNSVYREIELPLIPVLSDIERTGTKVDKDALYQQSASLAEHMAQRQQEVYELAGIEFNLNSTKQLQDIFYNQMNFPVLKKTPKGAPSTAEPVLQSLAEKGYKLPELILDYRSLAKLKSTYTDKLPKRINQTTGRIHTSYHQAVTATGRLSSTDPNLQNIPIRIEEGRKIRQAFIAEEGYQILAADYSQIELRIMAHLSQDEGLLNAFSMGKDIHKATAAEVFGVAVAEVSQEQRRRAKAINFGLIYGMSAFGLANQIKEDRATAKSYIDLYFERYPGVKAYMQKIRTQAHQNGYVETLFGRRLYLPEINASNKMRQQAAERTAINAPMQGTAADIIKKAMLEVHQWLQQSEIDAKVIMQVHDELVLEVREDQQETIKQGVIALMSHAANLAVPLLVEAGTGNNWDEAH